MKKGKREFTRGFTLVELMIALFVAFLVIAGYIGANVTIQRNAEETFERSLAIQDANQVIERIRDVVANASTNFQTTVLASYPNGSPVEGFTNLTDEVVTVSYVDTAANPLDTTVTVTWTSHTRRTMTATLKTLITKR